MWIEDIKETKHPVYQKYRELIYSELKPVGNFSVDMAYNILMQTLRENVKIYDEEAVKFNNTDTERFDNVYFNIFISENFKKHKQIYVLNPILFERLRSTIGIKEIDPDIIDKLPFPTFWLDMSKCNISAGEDELEGCFICHHKTIYQHPEYQKANINNALALVLKFNKNSKYKLIPIDINADENIYNAISRQWDSELTKSQIHEEYKKIFQDILQVVYYMCTVKPDIITKPKHKPQPNKSKKNDKKKKKKEITTTENQLGYRIGETLGKPVVRYVDSADEYTAGTGTKKSPHYRKAHWQTVRTGKGRENTELRWINLIYVNGVEKEVSDIITLHNMM